VTGRVAEPLHVGSYASCRIRLNPAELFFVAVLNRHDEKAWVSSVTAVSRARRVGASGPILAAALIGVVLTVFAWNLTSQSEDQIAAQQFAVRAGNQALILQLGIDNNLDRLKALRALFDSSSQTVSREEFEAFGHSLLQNDSAIMNVSWNPLVTRDERAANELAGAVDGLRDYHIRVVASDGSLPISPEHDEYVPKFYSTEPRTSVLYGLDVLDGGSRQQTVEQARDTDSLAATAPVLLHTGTGDRRGFWAGLPVYTFGLTHDTVESRRRHFRGVVQGVFQIGVMIDAIFGKFNAPLRDYIFASDAAPGDPAIYAASRMGTGPIEAKTQAALAAGLNRSFVIDVGDTHWTLVVAPDPVGSITTEHSRAQIVLLSGLLLCCALVAYMWTMRRYAGRLEAANALISDLARTDALTTLPNRRNFSERLAQSFAGVKRGGAPFAVLCFDLDAFKQVNDSYGHPVGDELLQQVAARAKNMIRETDVVARFGGDEFAVLQSNAIDRAAASVLACKLVDAIAAPYAIKGQYFRSSISLGIALYSTAVRDPESLMSEADSALYRAKAAGGNCFRFFDDDSGEPIEALGSMRADRLGTV
jgi:diguanylate cyclase (GGDEF)-like protein